MGGLIIVNVDLDWSGPGHYDPEHSLPCRSCDNPTKMRDNQGRPCHKPCAEGEIARELLGRGQEYIADERVPASAAELVDERFTSGQEGRR